MHWCPGWPLVVGHGISTGGVPDTALAPLFLLLAWLCLVLAIARPQHVGEQVQMPVSGRDPMLLVDIAQYG